MTKDEALKKALEAFGEIEWSNNSQWQSDRAKVAITAIKEALANKALEKMAENARELGLDYEPAQPFITHNVEQPYDWSEWVCPDPKNYLMKCCDCGLVHEAEFGVVRYKSETEREDCDMVDDPNLQAVFRMRRSEQWSPEDTAHRSGGLPMAQTEQHQDWCASLTQMLMSMPPKLAPCNCKPKPEYLAFMDTPQRTWVGLTEAQCGVLWKTNMTPFEYYQAIEAKLKEKNT